MTDLNLSDSAGNWRRNKQWNFESCVKDSGPLVGSPPKWKRSNSRDNGLPVRFNYNQTNHKHEDAAEREEVNQYFNKIFEFCPPADNWHLPDFADMIPKCSWEVAELMAMKTELNNVKNKLNNFNLDKWHQHTRSMNKAGSVLYTVKRDIAPEFPTQAWLKFYEICSRLGVVGEEAESANKLNSVHLCEAPGAFITALNHYLQLEYPNIKWSWISTTLNPYYEGNPLSIMINDDRFILHTMDRWKFGKDYTGNLMDLDNLLSITDEARQMGPVFLVTADGSIDCQNDPGEQEAIVSQLNYCEVVCALHILSCGGNFVVKMFTMYEHRAICLMYLLVCTFKKVHVFKPATSKEGNSEVYVVCHDYIGTDAIKPWLRKLRTLYGPTRSEQPLFQLSSIPEDFMNQLQACANQFKDYQIETIERNIYLFNLANHEQSTKRTRRLRYLVAEQYITNCKLKPLTYIGRPIVDPAQLENTQTPNMDPREEDGSFNDKTAREKLSPLEKLDHILKSVERRRVKWEGGEIKWLRFAPDKMIFDYQVGKSVQSVNSSKFCSGKLLKLRNDVRTLAREHFKYEETVKRSDAENKLSPELFQIIAEWFPSVQKDTSMLNYKTTLWSSLDTENMTSQIRAFHEIKAEIDEQWRGSRLVLQGYPMLTQFAVGFIYMLGHIFERVGFVRPQGEDFAVVFDSFRSWDMQLDQAVKKLVDLMEELESTSPDLAVLTVTPLKELIWSHPEFYSCVTTVNNLCVQEQIYDIINILKSKETKPKPSYQ